MVSRGILVVLVGLLVVLLVGLDPLASYSTYRVESIGNVTVVYSLPTYGPKDLGDCGVAYVFMGKGYDPGWGPPVWPPGGKQLLRGFEAMIKDAMSGFNMTWFLKYAGIVEMNGDPTLVAIVSIPDKVDTTLVAEAMNNLTLKFAGEHDMAVRVYISVIPGDLYDADISAREAVKLAEKVWAVLGGDNEASRALEKMGVVSVVGDTLAPSNADPKIDVYIEVEDLGLVSLDHLKELVRGIRDKTGCDYPLAIYIASESSEDGTAGEKVEETTTTTTTTITTATSETTIKTTTTKSTPKSKATTPIEETTTAASTPKQTPATTIQSTLEPEERPRSSTYILGVLAIFLILAVIAAIGALKRRT